MAYFPKYSTFFNLEKPLNFYKFEQNCRCQNERKLSVFRKFLGILCFAKMFCIKYIKKTFDWSKNEWIGITFLQVGKFTSAQIMSK